MTDHQNAPVQPPSAKAIRHYVDYIRAVEGDVLRELIEINQECIRACSSEITEGLMWATKMSHAHTPLQRMEVQRGWNINAAARATKYTSMYFDHLTRLSELTTKLADPSTASGEQEDHKPTFV